MPSSYSPLKIELMQQGEKNNQWGDITNTNLGTALEEAITGSADVTFASGNVTLTLTDTNASQTARNLRLNLIGTTAGARDLIVPAIEKLYFINNTCADTITVKNTTGTGIAVPAGKAMVVFNNATDVVDGVTHLTSLTLASSLPVASGGTGTTTSTGTGSVVLSNSPTLVTPALGTPSSATLTNATGLPISTGVSGLGTGVATFLGTPSSSNLAAAVTDETGSGALVFATSPALVTPLLGTPTSGVMTNVTGLPLTTGVTGTLPVGNGGTGATSFTSNGILYGGATVGVTAAGTTGQVLVGNTGGAPSWGAATGVAVTSINFGTTGLTPSTATQGAVTVAGTLAVANGGTGITSFGSGVATFLGTPSSANLAAAVTDETGSGSLVFATSPTLVTPALGTPSSATLTNATGLPISTGVSGLGTGVATFLGTPSSANLAAAVTDETGSGSLVFATSPTLVTPALGTPSSATLTNATGLPISTGVSGLGTGVATFLGTPSSANLASAVTDETGSGSLVFATSPTLVTPALGTPASGVMTNVTGLPLTTGVTGTLPVLNGGTGVTTSTGTGSVVLSNSPTLVTPALGTPSSATLTNATGLPISTGVSGLGTGVATFLATPSSANLAAAVTDETGSGSLVFANSPTLVTPTLGAASATSLALAAGLVATPSLTFTGDLNTGMWSPAADTIAWSTAGSERMRVTSAGDVGIGTSNPTLGRVQVIDAAKAQGSFSGWSPLTATSDAGAILIGASATAQGVLQYTPAGNTIVSLENTFNDASAALQFRMRTTGTPVTAMTILGSGNVGIGTVSPQDKLHVVGGNASTLRIDNTGQQYTSADWYNNNSSKATIYYDNTGAEFVVRTTSSANIGFDTNLTRKMTILSGGNVGIGVTNPGQALVVRREGDVRIYVEDDNASGRGGYLRSVTGGAVTLGTTSGVRDLVFAPDNSEKMRIAVGGNVGIGTASPDVFGRGYSGRILGISSAGQSAIEMNSATGSGAYFDMGVNGTRILSLYADATSTSLTTTGAQTMNIATTGASDLTLGTNNAERMRISSSGTITPGADNTQNFGSGSLRWATIVANGVTISSATAMLTSSVAMNNGAAASAGTLLNAPAAGDPTKWIPFNDNGTTRYIPAW